MFIRCLDRKDHSTIFKFRLSFMVLSGRLLKDAEKAL